MPLTRLSLVNNSVSPRTSESFFLQTRCGGIVRQEVFRNNRSTHGAATAVSPRAGHVSGVDGMATTPPQPSATSAPSSRSMLRPTSTSSPRFLEARTNTYSNHRRERRSSWLGLWSIWSIASRRHGLHVGRTSRIRGHNKAERALTKCSQAASTSAPHTLHMPE